MHNIVVIGSSGHARSIIDILELNERYKIVGLIDSFIKPHTIVNNYEVLGDEFMLPMICKKYNIYGGIVAIGNNWNRKIMIEKINKMEMNFIYISAIHPNAAISKKAIIGHGTCVMSCAVINTNTTIGKHCIINSGAIVEHDSVISDYASIATGALLAGKVCVGEKSAIGIGATIIEKTSVGDECIIGANSLINKTVPSYEIWYGIPGKFIKKNIPVIKYLK